MNAHNPPEILAVLLLTCPACAGSEQIQDSGRPSLCHSCVSGYQSVALPRRKVLAIDLLPEKDQYTALVTLAEEVGQVRHPLLYNAIDIPSKYQRPFLPNPSDALPRPKIPLT